jgi:hypothetical protein
VKRSSLAAVLGTLLAGSAGGQTAEEIVSALASDEMEGRLTGSEGERRAGEYIARELEKLSVRPLPGQSSLQLPFEFTAGVKDVGSSLVMADWKAPSDFLRGLSFSEAGRVSGAVVFAGYGITVPETQDFGYDSYHGLDVEDKIVLVLRYFPEDASTDVKSALARYSGLRFKALNARDRGARGLLVVSGPRSSAAGSLVEMSFDSAAADSGIVAASIDGRLGDELFRRAGVSKTLEETQKELDSGNPHASGFALPNLTVDLEVRLERELRTAHNVVGFLPATQAGALADRMVVVGAHYDHLGHGKEGNSLAGKEEAGAIHPGADDNASGVAAVLRIASLLEKRERRAPIAFALWSGEELGLLGSSVFVRGGALDSARIAAYVNFDMVGRMRDNRLVLQAIGTSTAWPRLIEQTNAPIGFDLQLSDDPYLPTDVMSFNQAGVPSINFFTGSHKEYHRPADRSDLLNYEDLERVADFGAVLVQKIAALEGAPDFVKVARTKQEGGGRDTLRVFTGTIPDYTTEVSGLRLSGVIEGGPAEEAGLRGGDVIVEFAGRKITNIYDYTYALDVVKVGEPIAVVFLRDGERKETRLTPRARK